MRQASATRFSTDGKQMQASVSETQPWLNLARVWNLQVLPLHKHFGILDMDFGAFVFNHVKLVLASL